MSSAIAIVGIGCLFPDARTPEEFWQNLLHGRDGTSEATAGDLGRDPGIFYDPRKGQTDKVYFRRGGYIRDFAFDPTGYRLPPKALVGRDPSVQWPLYAAREALKDSRALGSDLRRCGVILGNLSFPTRSSYRTYSTMYGEVLESGLRAALAREDAEEDPRFRMSPVHDGREVEWATSVPDDLSIAAAPAMVLAGALGLGGPCWVLDAACASSLYAIDLACRYLRAGESDLMLAGAVSAADPLMIGMGFSIFQAYPENGRSRPLDRSSGGLTSGEGAGVVVLKRYEDALRDRDQVYACVRSIGLSNDGAGRHPLIPKRAGQEAALLRAYGQTNVAPASIQYIECHATGTPTGDIVELDAMESFFGRPVPCGSVKSNFGHLLTAAGMASTIKVLLAMQRGVIPPTIGVDDPLGSTNGVTGGSTIVRAPTPWPDGPFPRRAGINAFGFGGTNAHLILESAGHEEEELRGDDGTLTRPSMVITGMDLCFGGAPDLAAYSSGIEKTGIAQREFPRDRWIGLESRKDALSKFGLDAAPPGRYLEGFPLDLMRARVQPDDMPVAQHLLLMKVADNAIRDAGLSPGGQVAVLVAMDTDLSLHRYRARVDLSWQIAEALAEAGIELSAAERGELERAAKDVISDPGQVNRYMSFIGNIMASRVSALWDFSGPAFTVSAGTQSLTRALEVARMLLAEGEIEAVVVGAVDLAGGPESVLRRNAAEPYTNGPGRLVVDSAALGPTVGEGAGAVVLQRADDGSDRTYTVVDAVCLVNPQALRGPAGTVAAACRDALAEAGMRAAEVGYMDVCANGLTESRRQVADGILTAYGRNHETPSCALGSASSELGDAGAATLMAALIRTALCLGKRTLPGTSLWSGPDRPEIWKGSPFYVPPEARPWLVDDGARRHATLTHLAADGSAAHVVLSEPRAGSSRTLRRGANAAPPVNSTALGSSLIPIGGSNLNGIVRSLDDLERAIANGVSLPAVAIERLRAQVRNPETHTLSLVAGNTDELLREIERARAGVPGAMDRGGEWSTPAGSYFAAAPLGSEGVCYVYPGGFSSYLGQGRELFHLVPSLHDRLSNRLPHLPEMLAEREIYPRSMDMLTAEQMAAFERQLLEQSDVATASASVLAIATTSILRDVFGVKPHFAIGYSLGEATMLWALGIWSDLRTAHERFRTWSGMPVDERARGWKTYLLLASPETVQAAIADQHDVYLTIVSTAGEVFVAGDPEACERLIGRLGCGSTVAPFSQILHCPPVHRAFDALAALYRYPISARPEMRLYTGAHYGPMVLEEEAISQSIAGVICRPLDFPRLVRGAYDGGARVFVEMGPGGMCARWIRSALRGKPHITTAVDGKGVPSGIAFMRTLAKLLSHGVPVDLSPLTEELASAGEVASRAGEHPRGLLRQIDLGGPNPHAVLAAHRGSFHTSTRVERDRITPSRTPALISIAVPISALAGHTDQVGEAHRATLQMRREGLRLVAELVQQGMDALGVIAETDASPAPSSSAVVPADVRPMRDAMPRETASSPAPIWADADLLEFASGRIESVFGPDYASIDRYSRRVRLPMPPYLLVNRVTGLTRSSPGLSPATITTEYDVPFGAWYSSNGRLPVGIAIEAGQCDLLLISYLGIDFQNRGERVYRLLDCTLTFTGDLPREGQTLRYEISIDSFARSGESLLFFFHYRCFSGDVLLLKMDNGCAGFFTDHELESGRGVIETESERKRRLSAVPRRFTPLRRTIKHQFGRDELAALSRGNVAACFGRDHAGPPSPGLRLPPADFLMLDRVVSVEPEGGSWGLGVVVAEKDLCPSDWYFPCHFKGDEVLAGSLVAEGCVQLLQFYLLYLGLHVDLQDAVFQPIRDLAQRVRCRGQITPRHSRLTYRMEITSIEGQPVPAARANVDIIVDGRIVVRFTDLGVRIDGEPVARLPVAEIRALPLFNEDQVREFATGSIVACFGREYEVYSERRTPRIPNGDLQFISRVVEIEGQRGNLTDASRLTAEYDVPPDVWFYRELSDPGLRGSAVPPDPPYSVLMEMALQPCGFLSGWLGSTLHDPGTDFYFRNLDGRGRLLRRLDLRGRTVDAQVRLRNSTRTVGVIIQSFDFQLSCEGTAFYEGDAVFGYFTPDALQQQTGLDGGRMIPTWRSDHPEMAGEELDRQRDRRLFSGTAGRPQYRLPEGHLDLLDRAFIDSAGGTYGRGYVECSRTVRPDDWFFTCHFFQDPVMPGSLGVEAMIEALQIFALRRGIGDRLSRPRFHQVLGGQTVWKYRGQIRRESREMRLEVHLREIESSSDRIVLWADGSLWRDGLRIYEVNDLAVEVREA